MGLNWCKYISHEQIAKTFAYGLPIVSVGSGSGMHERKLELRLKTNIICVDPLVEKYINMDQVDDRIIEHISSGGYNIFDIHGEHTRCFRTLVTNYAFGQSDEFSPLFHKPDYRLVKYLIKDRPELINACHLLLIWTSPNSSHYDYDAIIELKPKYITIVYDSTGGAGGEKLHEYINGLPEGAIITRVAHEVINIDRFSIELLCIKL